MSDEELKELRAKINKSMENIVKMVLQVKKRVDQIDERLAVYNQKAGHKI